MPISLFFPEPGPGEDMAVAEERARGQIAPICASCPVSTECFLSACEAGDEGLWAATLTTTRAALRSCGEKTRTRLAALKTADALDIAREKFEREGPDPDDTAGLTATEIQAIWGITRSAARKLRNSNAVSTGEMIVMELRDGTPQPRMQVIRAVSEALKQRNAEYASTWHAARAGVIRLERNGQIARGSDADGVLTIRLARRETAKLEA